MVSVEPRLCRGTGSRSSDSGSRAEPWGMIPFIFIRSFIDEVFSSVAFLAVFTLPMIAEDQGGSVLLYDFDQK